jgi:hypothetical protein
LALRSPSRSKGGNTKQKSRLVKHNLWFIKGRRESLEGEED